MATEQTPLEKKFRKVEKMWKKAAVAVLLANHKNDDYKWADQNGRAPKWVRYQFLAFADALTDKCNALEGEMNYLANLISQEQAGR